MAKPGFGVQFRLVSDEASVLFQDIADRAIESHQVLKRWGGFLREGAKKAFVDRAPPLAASTLYKYQHQGTSSVTAHGEVRASYARKLDTMLRRKGNTAASAELRRVLSGDLTRRSKTNKTVDRLRRRLEKARAGKAIGARLAIGKTTAERRGDKRGGNMGKAWKVDVQGLSVTVRNMVPYSGVHDEGGQVGNGAQLPEWNFMFLDDQGAEQLAEIALAWLMEGR